MGEGVRGLERIRVDPRGAEQVIPNAGVLEAITHRSREHLSRSVHSGAGDLQTILAPVMNTAVSTIQGVDYVGVNLLRGGVFEPQALHGASPVALDSLQQRTGLGPCIDSSRDQRLIRVDEMTLEDRWPQYVSLANSLGVRAMLCVPLRVDAHRPGSISLYSRTPGAFGSHDERIANLLAVQAAVALANAQRAAHLALAVHNRDIIGQAKGILMERHRITAEVAFELLSAASQRTNRKVSAIAEELASAGDLPS